MNVFAKYTKKQCEIDEADVNIRNMEMRPGSKSPTSVECWRWCLTQWAVEWNNLLTLVFCVFLWCACDLLMRFETNTKYMLSFFSVFAYMLGNNRRNKWSKYCWNFSLVLSCNFSIDIRINLYIVASSFGRLFRKVIQWT